MTIMTPASRVHVGDLVETVSQHVGIVSALSADTLYVTLTVGDETYKVPASRMVEVYR